MPENFNIADAISQVRSNYADAVALNPQPLPPKANIYVDDGVRQNIDFDAVALNPQPLPPKRDPIGPVIVMDGQLDLVALNPQPLPPKANTTVVDHFRRSIDFDAVALNPQPLPPKFDPIGPVSRFVRFDAVALNPQPLPPKPDPDPEPKTFRHLLAWVSKMFG